MKRCFNCQNMMNDSDVVCPKCNAQQESMRPMSGVAYCEKCGNEVMKGSAFCGKCGTPLVNQYAGRNAGTENGNTNPRPMNNNPVPVNNTPGPINNNQQVNNRINDAKSERAPRIVEKLITGLKISSIFGLISAGIYLLLGLLVLLLMFIDESFSDYLVCFLLFTFGGIWNIVVNIANLILCPTLRDDYTGIVSDSRFQFKLQTLNRYTVEVVLAVIFVILLGCIGAVCALPLILDVVLDIALVRGFVSTNKKKFLELENIQIAENQNIAEEKRRSNCWKCPKCGSYNAMYVGSCGCGYNRDTPT